MAEDSSHPVIEPSEIIIEGREDIHVRLQPALPWNRFIARFFDYALFFAVLQIVPLPFSFPIVSRFFYTEYLAWVPVEILCLLIFGTTPGKWLLCMKVQGGRAKRLSLRTVLIRSLGVYFRGIGMGIPFLNVLCMLHAFYRVRLFPAATWDRDAGTMILQRPLAQWRYYAATICVVAGMLFYSFWRR